MQGKMRSDLYRELYEVENTHWWHLHKRATVHQMIAKYIPQKGRVLDIGSGTGKILEELKVKGWQVEGIDGAPEAVEWSQKRGIPIKQTDFVKDRLPYENKYFDLVLALDLLEHLPNDKEVLSEMYRITKSGGIAVFTVPAYQWLFDYWDQMLGHQRRYSIIKLKKMARDSGWEIKFSSYYFCLFFIPAVPVRFFKKVFSKHKTIESDFKTTPIAWLSVPVMNIYAKIERWFLKLTTLPFGLSIILVLKKYAKD